MTASLGNRAAGLFGLAAMGALWLAVIRQFGPQWTVFPQYNYGWGVPFLCLYLLWQRWGQRPAPEIPRRRIPVICLAASSALLLASARWAHEANATWRVTTWLMALGVVTISLAGIYLAAGRRWARHFAFPICFFLIAVPWPARLEESVVQNLTRMNVAATVEAISFSGVPAIQHGNVIEVSTGMVGIDEACSGIRSLQATLMVALFFGELYRFPNRRRIGLVAIGVLLAFIFNLGRTFLLVSVGARQGIEAISKWHDPAGVTILVGCFTGLWAAAGWLRPKITNRPTRLQMQPSDARPIPRPTLSQSFSIAIIILVIAMECGTELWYRAHEGILPHAPVWAVQWPEGEQNFTHVKLPERVIGELAFDEGSAVNWLADNGSRWQAFFFRWLPKDSLSGRVKLQSVKSHRPDVCLPATGLTQTADLGVEQYDADGLMLPFHRYVFEDHSGPIYVFYCFWEDGVRRSPGQVQMLENPLSRLAAARDGVRGVGERIFELAVTGVKDEAEADAAFKRLLPKVITRP